MKRINVKRSNKNDNKLTQGSKSIILLTFRFNQESWVHSKITGFLRTQDIVSLVICIN